MVSDELSGEVSGEVRRLLCFSQANRFVASEAKAGTIFLLLKQKRTRVSSTTRGLGSLQPPGGAQRYPFFIMLNSNIGDLRYYIHVEKFLVPLHD